MKVALTGHQIERLRGQEAKVNDWLEKVLNKINKENAEVELLCGCAAGSDELFGMTAYWYPNFKLTLCKPVKGYRQGKINDLEKRATQEFCIAEEWKPGLDTKRDKFMVSNCDILLAVWDGIETGGTWQTIKYARKLNKKIIYIDKEIFYS